MAVGFSATVANAFLDAVCRNVSYANANVYIKLHVGDPGAAGTSNPAGNTTRQQATFATPASGGLISNTAAILWTNVSTSEDYTHFSAWTASSGGTFLFSGTVTANAVGAGDNFQANVGDLDVPFALAA